MQTLSKIKKNQLVGRGGACFPVDVKWKAVKDAPGKNKYVVCNAAEGEPGVHKDGYILDNYPDRVIEGIRLARRYLKYRDSKVRVKSYIYINQDYLEKYEEDVKEEKRSEPRLKPPFPTTKGLWNRPTIVNNVETLYNVSLVDKGEYKKERF